MVTDAELIFWVVAGVIVIGIFWWIFQIPSMSVSEQTIKRIEKWWASSLTPIQAPGRKLGIDKVGII